MNPLSGIELKIERAKEHLDALLHEVRMFMKEPQPDNAVADENPQGGGYIIRAKLLHPPPYRFALLVGDFVHNMRASLDMLAWELAQTGDDPPPDDDTKTAFPLCTEESAWDLRSTRDKVKRIPPDAIKVIKHFQPYKRKDLSVEPLALLQALDNWDKHKALLTVSTFYIHRLTALSGHTITQFKAGAFEDGDEICRITPLIPKPNLQDHFQAHMSFTVGFAKEGPARGLGVGKALGLIYNHVQDTVLPAFKTFFPSGSL